MLVGTGAWSQQAYRVRELATRLGLLLDEQTLVLQDVHDLQVMEVHLHRLEARQGWRIWAAPGLSRALIGRGVRTGERRAGRAVWST